jgi:hypothetical protein
MNNKLKIVFVGCAIAANAGYIVANYKHFQILKGIEFPKVNILTVEEFKQLLS